MNGKNNAQVGVVVAILMVSLLVAVMVLIQVYYVPNWMKDKEANHMDTVADQFSNLKFSIDLQAMSHIDVPIASSVTLGSKELPYFVSSRAFGSLNVLPPTSSNFSISVTAQSGMERNLYQQLIQSPYPRDVNYAEGMSRLDLIINTLADGDTFNVSVNGNKNIEVSVSLEGSGYRILLETINGTQVLFNQTIAVSLPQHEYIINLLNPDYKFYTDVLPYMNSPYNMTLNGTSNGDFRIKCYVYSSATISLSSNLGTIRYTSDNSYFVDQTYVYEGGAVIIGQYDGEAIISPPFVSFGNYTSTHTVNLSVVNINGIAGKTSASGYGTYSVRTNYSGYSDYMAMAKSVTINITTSYPSAWYRYLDNMIRSSGINNTTNVSSGNGYVSMTLDGPQGSGSSYDVNFYMRTTDIYAQVGPGWVT
ncbi:MAG: hypothetical protein J7L93_00310 [Thermoplasmata archaeon]|nr:hypothetical protein [Thermoplasmata archaeon]